MSTTHKLKNTNVAPHDFSLTENHYIFVENRVSGNTLPYILGTKCPAQCVDINSDLPMILNLVRRPQENEKSDSKSYESASKSKPLTVTEVPLVPGFTIHSVCAFENVAINVDPINCSNEKDKTNKSGGGIPGTIELITTAWESKAVSEGKVLRSFIIYVYIYINKYCVIYSLFYNYRLVVVY